MRFRVLCSLYVMTRFSSLWFRPLPGPTAKKDPEGGHSFALTKLCQGPFQVPLLCLLVTLSILYAIFFLCQDSRIRCHLSTSDLRPLGKDWLGSGKRKE